MGLAVSLFFLFSETTTFATTVTCTYPGPTQSIITCSGCEGATGGTSCAGPTNCRQTYNDGLWCQDTCDCAYLHIFGKENTGYCGSQASDIACRADGPNCEYNTGPGGTSVGPMYGCGMIGGSPDFSISSTPGSAPITQGQSQVYAITLASLNSYSGNVSLTAICPTNATCNFDTSALAVPSDGTRTTNYTVSNTNSTPVATHTITFTGTDSAASLTHQTSSTLTVSAGGLSHICPSGNQAQLSSSSINVGATTQALFPPNYSNLDGTGRFWTQNSGIASVDANYPGTVTGVSQSSTGIYGTGFYYGPTDAHNCSLDIATITVTSGVPPNGTLQGRVWVDTNRDGSGTGEPYLVDPSGPGSCTQKYVLGGVTINYSGPVSGSVLVNLCDPPYYAKSLPPGSYTVSISVPAGWSVISTNPQSGSVASNGSLDIWFAIQPPPPAPILFTSPANFSFTATQGGANPASQSLTIRNDGPAGSQLNWNISNTGSWLTARRSAAGQETSGVEVSGGTATPAPDASINISGLSVGTYNATISVTSNGGNASIPVTLNINPPAPTADIKVSDPWSGVVNSNGPITTVYNNIVNLSWTSTNATSCTVTGNSQNFSGTSSAGTATSNLTASATYTINCSGPGGNSSPDSVTINIPPPPTSPIASCPAPGTSATLSWTAPAGGYNTFKVGINIGNADYITYPYEFYENNNITGTTFSLPPPTTPGQTYTWIVRTIDINTGAFSSYVGGVFTCASAAIPSIQLSESTMTFSGTSGGSAPAGQTFTVKNNGAVGSTLKWHATTNSNWCYVNGVGNGSYVSGADLAQGATSVALNVTVGLPSNTGSPTCTIDVWDNGSSPAASPNHQWIDITYNVKPSDVSGVSVAITAACPAAQTVDLTWNAAQSGIVAKTYNIYRNTTGAAPTAGNLITNVSTLSYTDTPPPGTYYYWVETLSAGFTSPSKVPSSPVKITLAACPAPVADIKGTVAAAVPFIGYTNSNGPMVVYSGATFQLLWTCANSTSATIDGTAINPVASGSGSYTAGGSAWSHTYTLVCTGSGSDSDTITVSVPPAPTVPLGNCPAPGTSATISWTAPSGYTHFLVRAYDLALPWPPPTWIIYDDDYIGVSAPLSGTTPGHTYSWWVHTRGASGAWSDGVGTNFSCAAAVCQAGTVSLGSSSISAGGSTTASAPAGWSGGQFNSSNSAIANIPSPSSNPATVNGVSPGPAQISGFGWTDPGGATSCPLNNASLTVTAASTYSYTVTPTLDLTAQQNAAGPSGDITVTNTGNQALTINVAEAIPWANINKASVTLAPGANTTVTVTITDTNQSVGLHTGAVNFSHPQAGNQSATVNFNVTPSGGGPGPSPVTLDNSQCGKMIISWADIGATSYNIYRNTTGVAPTIGVTAPTFTNATSPKTDNLSADSYSYWVTGIVVGVETSAVAPTGANTNPTSVTACSQASLITSDKDIAAINAVAVPTVNPCNNSTNVLPGGTSLKLGDTLTFNLNICNNNVNSTGPATNISVTDTMTNLKIPDAASHPLGWNVKYCPPSASCVSLTQGSGADKYTVSGTAPNQTISINLTNRSLVQATFGYISFDAQLAIPASFNGASARFQNIFSIGYNLSPGTPAVPVSGFTPLLLFSTGLGTPIIIEVP